MYTFFSPNLAHDRQKNLLREAQNERLAKRIRTQTELMPVAMPTVVAQQDISSQGMLSETDFIAIKRDLRSTLSQWSQETGATNTEVAIDTFMQHLRQRLGGKIAKVESTTH